MDLGEQAHQVRFMIRDCGSNYAAAFDAVLAAEPVGLVFAVRETDEEPKLAGLPELRVHGLGF